jgi:RimJ/RimL family protein N-acetyltransferase
MLTFRPFDEESSNEIRSWFSDPETKRWLGDESWVDMELEQQKDSIGTEFRGVKTLARYGWVVYENDNPIGYIDAGIGDKYVKYGGEDQNGPIYLEIEDVLSSGIAFLVNPSERGRGIAAKMIKNLIERPVYKDVSIFEAGVEPENIGSIKVLEKAGFISDYIKDFEGMYYFLLRR